MPNVIRQVMLMFFAGLSCAAGVAMIGVAAFIFAEDRFGTLPALCAVGVGYLVIGLIAFSISASQRKAAEQAELARRKAAKQSEAPSMPSLLADPMLLTAGMQLVRSVGLTRLVPVLAIAAAAAGYIATRGSSSNEEDDIAE